MRRWLRLDAEWEESEWLHSLRGESAGCWPRLLCWVKLRGTGGRCRWPSAAVLAHQWRMDQPVVETLIAAALAHGAVTREGQDLVVANWDTYQEPADRTNAERQKRFRERQAEAPVSTETVTEVTDRNARYARDNVTSLSMSMSGVGVEVAVGGEGRGKGGDKRKRAWKFCPADWNPTAQHAALAAELGLDLAAEVTGFRDHEFREPKTDPDRAFSRWLRYSESFRNPFRAQPKATNGNGIGTQRAAVSDAEANARGRLTHPVLE